MKIAILVEIVNEKRRHVKIIKFLELFLQKESPLKFYYDNISEYNTNCRF